MKHQLHKRVPLETVKSLLGEYHAGRLGRKEACRYLGVGKTRFYALYKRYLRSEMGGDPFAVYGKRRKTSHAFSAEDQRLLHEELGAIKELPAKIRRYNFAVVAEEVHKKLGRVLHRNSIRRFAIRHGYYSPCQEKRSEPYKQFEMGAVGMLFQHDASPHLWVPHLKKATHLIATVDDHSRFILKGSLVEHEGAWEHMYHAEAICKKHGLAAIWYLDRDSIFTFTVVSKSIWQRRRVGAEGETQFAMMMEGLGIQLWFAPTAQAKGKIENKFKYLQARVPILCARRKATTLQQGQEIVDEVIDYYNTQRSNEETGEIPLARWNTAFLEGRSRLRPVPEDIDWDYVSSFKCSRTVDGYGTLSYRGNSYKIRNVRDAHVTVCERPGEKIAIYLGKERVAVFYISR